MTEPRGLEIANLFGIELPASEERRIDVSRMPCGMGKWGDGIDTSTSYG
jgi:hypothetical protein